MQNVSYVDQTRAQVSSNKLLIIGVLAALFIMLIVARMAPEGQTPLLGKVMVLLGPTLATASAGAYYGRQIRSWIAVIGLFVLAIIGVFLIRAAGGSDIAVGLLLGWGFITGMMLGPTIAMAVVEGGSQIVMQALVGTTTIMMGTGFIALATGIDFSFLAPVLMLGLFGLIIVGLISIFVRFSRTVSLTYSILGIVIFSGYFLFDFFRLSKSQNTWDSAVQLTTKLYLDFANLFLYILYFLMQSRRR